MSIDLRVKHDLESRRRAVELFDAGVGCKPAAEALSVPRETVREWQWVYRAFGSEALLSMDGKQSSYTFEQRVAAASAVVDGGMAKTDAMAEFFPAEVSFTKPEGGMFLWATLPEGVSTMELFPKALERNVAFVPGDPFYPEPGARSTMRLNFTNADEETIRDGIQRLGEVIAAAL